MTGSVPFGTYTAAIVVMGFAAAGMAPQEVVDSVPLERWSEWAGPPGMLILLYEASRRGLDRFRKVEDKLESTRKRQQRIAREIGLHFDDEG